MVDPGFTIGAEQGASILYFVNTPQKHYETKKKENSVG